MPDWRYPIERRLDGLRIAPEREREIVDELSQHLDDRYNELRAGGATEDVARREALAELDDADLVRELTGIERSRTGEPLALGAGANRRGLLGGVWRDLRFGARLLVKDRVASLVVVFTLALAIAANAIVFGFADLLILRPLPLGNAKDLVTIFGVDRRSGSNRERLSIADYLDLTRQATSFVDVAADRSDEASLTGAGDPLAVVVSVVTPNIFSTWDLGPFAGRTFLRDEGTPGRMNVTVLSHRFWTAHFAADPTIIGRAVTINGESHTVVGVLTPAIEIGDLADIDLWLPLDTSRAAETRNERPLTLYALRPPGVTLDAINAELTTIGERLQRADPLNHADWRLHAMTLRESTVGASTWIYLALLGVVTMLVLVVACANVATVMLARASARRKEIALRLALGATRGRLVRQLLAEGFIVGCVSGAFGLVLGYAGLVAFRLASPESYFQRLTLNGNLLAFACALSLLAPLLFAVMPALQSSRPDLTEDLKDGGRDASDSLRGNRRRAILVVAQVGFALAVLFVAGLVVRTVNALEHVPVGFTFENILTTRVRFDPPAYRSDEVRRRTVESILERLSAIPGLSAAAATYRLPLIDGEARRRFTIIGRAPATIADLPSAFEVETLGDYPHALGVTLLEGRMWRVDDATRAVAVVNREAVHRYWPGESPVGAHIAMVDAGGEQTGEPIEIIGVIENVLSSAVTQPPPPRLYRPLGGRSLASVVFIARAHDDSGATAPAVRDVLRDVDRNLAVSQVLTFTSQIASFRRTYELIVALFVGFAAIGLIIAVTSVYGVTAFAVNQRRHEIGVRMALGATGGDVIRLFVGRSSRLIAAGLVVGIVAGWAIGRAMDSVLVGTSATDPATFVTVIALLVASGVAASLVPAWSAVSIDPIAVLKNE